MVTKISKASGGHLTHITLYILHVLLSLHTSLCILHVLLSPHTSLCILHVLLSPHTSLGILHVLPRNDDLIPLLSSEHESGGVLYVKRCF